MLTTNILFLAMSTNHRFYSFDMAMVVLATHLWWTSLKNEDSKKSWWIYALSMAGVISSMFVSVAIAIPHAIFYIAFSRRKLRSLGRFTALAIILLAMLGLYCIHDPTSYGILTRGYNLKSDTEHTASFLLSNGFRLEQLLSCSNGPQPEILPPEYFQQLLVINFAVCLAMISGICWPISAKIKHQATKHSEAIFTLLVLGLFLAIASLVVFSIFGSKLVTANYLSWTLPFTAMMFAQGLNAPLWARRWIFPVFCLGLMYGTPLLAQGSYICGPGCSHMRDTVAMFSRPTDIVIVDGNCDMPGLQDYYQDDPLIIHAINRLHRGNNPVFLVSTIEKMTRRKQPILLTRDFYMKLLTIAPRLSFMRGRRIWVLYKARTDSANATLVNLVDAYYAPGYSTKVREVLWHFPEGKVSLLSF